MQIKAIIVDDEERSRRVLRSMLLLEDSSIDIIAECSNVPSAVIEINKHQPDVVFLDVEMPDYSGFELFSFFNGAVDFKIVFVTAYSEYAIKAFEVSAIDYILKPLSPEAVLKTIQKIKSTIGSDTQISNETLIENLKSKRIDKIAVPDVTGLVIIKTADLLYIEADGAYSRFHFKDGKSMLVSKGLKFYENILDELTNFYRPHRSHIVNLDFLKQYNKLEGLLQLETGQNIPVARSNRIDTDIAIRRYLDPINRD